MKTVTEFREVRLLLAYEGVNYQLARVSIDRTGEDASLYIYPYSKNSVYQGLRGTLQPDGSGNYRSEIDVSSSPVVVDSGVPHLSLHESGRVHVRLDNSEQPFGMLWAKPFANLADANGDHIASINVSSLEALPRLLTEPDEDKSKLKHDSVIKVIPSAELGSIEESKWQAQTYIIYASVDQRKYKGQTLAMVDVIRSVGRPSVFFTICHRPAGINYVEGDEPSVVIIGGWNPDQMDKHEPVDMMVVRAT